MKQYIERDALLEEDFTDMFLNLYDEAVFAQIVKLVPAADVIPVRHGKWIITEYPSHLNVECSVCNKSFYVNKQGQYRIEQSDYCPNCGADMRGAAAND